MNWRLPVCFCHIILVFSRPISIMVIFAQDMWLYLSEHENFNHFGSAQPTWHETNIPYAVWGPESTRTLSLKYHPSEVMSKGYLNNGY